MSKRFLLLEVEESRADELRDALEKRSYLRVLDMNRENRSRLVSCPFCTRKLGSESAASITVEMLEALVLMLQAMAVSRSVVLYHAPALWTRLSVHAQERAVLVSAVMHSRLLDFKLIEGLADGSQMTYFVTARAMDFLSGDARFSPATVIKADGIELAQEGDVHLDEIKVKDRIKYDIVRREARVAIDRLPMKVQQFVRTGQISLL